MRARSAYISSFGTTTILVAGALLMLALVSALVAFKGFPGQSSGSGVQSVPLAPPSSTVRTAAATRTVPATTIARARRAARPAAPARVSAAGLVKTAPSGSGTARVVPGLVMVPVSTVTMVAPQPVQPATREEAPQTLPTTDPDPSTDPVRDTLDLLPDSPLPPPPGEPTPAAEDVTEMVGTLLGGAPPEPVTTVPVGTSLPVDVAPGPGGVTVGVGGTTVSVPLP